MNIKNMTFEQVVEFVYDEEKRSQLDEVEHMALDDKLTAYAWQIAGALDKTHDTDPRKGRAMYGTPNKKSYTYKVRKAVGFSYP